MGIVGCQIHDSLLKAHQILACRGRGYSTLTRNVWYILQDDGVTYKPLGFTPMIAGGTIKYDVAGTRVDQKWGMNYNDKVKVWNEEINAMTQRSNKLEPASRTKFDNLTTIGSIRRKQKPKIEKDQFNGLISDAVNGIFGINKDNSTYGQTQYTPEFRDAAIKKRLDTMPINTPPHIIKELHNIMDLMLTAKAWERLDTYGYATKEEVEVMVNNQGATGLFDQGHNL